ncbi:MAG TPA: N-6 DNA methylase [Thermoanaerobaculia bacterium]|nr:N-6 DNA methylase [Thermoanaerobaculia bacterium]
MSRFDGLTCRVVLKSILERCEAIDPAAAFPGEGGERPFRGWLRSEFLEKVLGWPPLQVLAGERFDILLLDDGGHPVVYIETKPPAAKKVAKEFKTFENRLREYPTLRSAYFTNGYEWDRLDLAAPSGSPVVVRRTSLNLDTASESPLADFFDALDPVHYLGATHKPDREHRVRISSSDSHALTTLTATLEVAVESLTEFFRPFFEQLRQGAAGETTAATTVSIFHVWCDKSLIVPPESAAKLLRDRFSENAASPNDLTKALLDLGFEKDAIAPLVDDLVPVLRSASNESGDVVHALWPAYVPAIRTFCAQSAHVLLARVLLYRIGEDKGLFPRTLEQAVTEAATRADVIADSVLRSLPVSRTLTTIRQELEDFSPAVYKLGEFDWSLVPEEKRSILTGSERAWLHERDSEFELIATRLASSLTDYDFANVDVDVWRNVYQTYLPPEERQRLGGFYTPDELVNLVLDLSEFVVEMHGLCHLTFIDPACGSGAFVTGALSRLLRHLQLPLDCHERFAGPAQRPQRAAAMLKIVAHNVHGIDVHPFAAFLTTINVLFLLMPLYELARKGNQEFTLELDIFSADSLDNLNRQLIDPGSYAKLNSRIHLTLASFERFKKMLGRRFDRVFGNPPWGGILKGPLAPVYDEAKKQRFASEYPFSAHGKYDVYALFIERATHLLSPNGRFGFVTQGTFIDKEWASGVRKLLSSKTRPRVIADMNPFGQLYFSRMNTPCVTTADLAEPQPEDSVIAVTSSGPPTGWADLTQAERRRLVADVIRDCVDAALSNGRGKIQFASATTIPISELARTAKDGWDLSGREIRPVPKSWLNIGSVYEANQGVTPGGEGSLDIFLLTRPEAVRHGLEPELLRRVAKGADLRRWVGPTGGSVILYPYASVNGEVVPAFTVTPNELDDDMRDLLRRSRLNDALDFDVVLDNRESAILRKSGLTTDALSELLNHRISLGLVRFPATAKYLVGRYSVLESRTFKKKNIRTFNRRWYEYIWPRDAAAMLGGPKLLTPRLVKDGIDASMVGPDVVPQDSCIWLVASKRSAKAYNMLAAQLSSALGEAATAVSVYAYCAAFLNASDAYVRLTSGQIPTPKGFYAVTEKHLAKVPIPPPKQGTARSIVETVLKLEKSSDPQRTLALEADLQRAIDSAFAAG